jgi:hypothetical protein
MPKLLGLYALPPATAASASRRTQVLIGLDSGQNRRFDTLGAAPNEKRGRAATVLERG